MSADPSSQPKWNKLLSRALRGIRRARLMRAQDVATAMGLPLRSYEHFEAGGGRLSLERIHAFARVTDSDPHAILASVMIESPEFAVSASGNKLMAAYMIALREFNEDLQADIARIDTRTLLTAFTQMFESLAADARTRKAWTQATLTGGIPPSEPSPLKHPADGGDTD